jgi:hypothetical protein
VAVAGGVLVVLLLGMAMCSGGGAGRGSGAAGLSSPIPTPPTATSPTATSPTATSPVPTGLPAPMTVPPDAAGGPALGSPSTSAGSVAIPGLGGPRRGPGAGAGAARTCPDSAITLTVSSFKPSYPVGDTPVLKLTIRNTARVTCRRDIGARQQQIVVYAGRTRVWSSNDCYPGGAKDVRALEPGQVVTSTVVWSGRSSRPGCSGRRTQAGAGTYLLVGQLGTLRSAPASLVLT